MNQNKPVRQLTARLPMMPRDTNGQGKISGGVILSQIDLAAALVARRSCTGRYVNRVVTRAMDKVEFKEPVLVNDVLTCYSSVLNVGRTSVAVHVEMEADRSGQVIPVTEATAVFVALNKSGFPTPIQAKGRSRSKLPPVVIGAKRLVGAPVKIVAAGIKTAVKDDDRILAVRKIMMPYETNGMGNIFGGLLLTYMDYAGAYVARRVCSNQVIDRVVTRYMDRIEFREAVHVNDVLSCYGSVTHIGDTSISVHVDVEVERGAEVIAVTRADLVYVAVDNDGKPISVNCALAKSKAGC